MTNEKAVKILLRISIASVFLYAAAAATLQPNNWIGYIPPFIRGLFPSQIILPAFSLYQLLLSIWIISARKTIYAASLAAITLLGIIGSNFKQTDILFRDFAIFFAALALGATDRKKKVKKTK